MNNRSKNDEFLRLYSFAAEWVKTQMKPFTSEDMKKAFYATKNKPVENCKLFGGCMVALHADKLIIQHDYAKAKDRSAHSRIIVVWISREYSLKQSGNRKAPYKNQTQLF